MSTMQRSGMLVVATIALLGGAVFLAGCAEEEQPAPPPADGEPADEQANEVEVGLIEWDIDMPETLPPGPTTFQVSNNGNMAHDLAIQGQGINQELRPGDADLEAGESDSMQVDLQPGEYRVWCPVGNHAEQGMEMTLTVEQQQ